MISLSIRVGSSTVHATLGLIVSRMRDMTGAMRLIGNVVRETSARSFKEQRAPDGTAWRQLSAASVIARARRHSPKGFAKRRTATIKKFSTGAQALLDTGALRSSIQVTSVTPRSVTVGTNLPYAAIHQFGGMAGRGRKVRIPARPFMGIDERGARQIVDTLREYILKE